MSGAQRDSPGAGRRLVANVVLDGRIGGPQRRIAQVGKRLRVKGWDTLAVFPNMGDELPKFLDSHEIKYETSALSRIRRRQPVFNLMRYCIRLPLEVVWLIALFRRRHVDIVHANGLFSLQVALAARLSGRPLIWHFNDMSLPAWLSAGARRLFGGLAHYRVYSSRLVMTHYGDWDGARTALFYPPVDLETSDPARISEGNDSGIPVLDRRGEEFLLLALGHINPLKGYGDLLSALEPLVTLAVAWRLVIVGAPLETNREYFDALNAQVRDLGLEKRVTFAGATQRIPEVLAACDAVVMCSVAESGPMVVLEALAMGKPVVATAVGIVPEIYRDGDEGEILVVPPRNPERLSLALKRAIEDDSLRQENGESGRRQLVARYSVDRAANEHMRVYDQSVTTTADRVKSG